MLIFGSLVAALTGFVLWFKWDRGLLGKLVAVVLLCGGLTTLVASLLVKGL